MQFGSVFRIMTRRLDLLCLWCAVLVLVLSSGAMADELPLRKPGLWQVKLVHKGSGLPELSMQHCTDVTTDREMNNTVSPMAKQICSKQEVRKTATGYVVDSICSIGAGP